MCLKIKHLVASGRFQIKSLSCPRGQDCNLLMIESWDGFNYNDSESFCGRIFPDFFKWSEHFLRNHGASFCCLWFGSQPILEGRRWEMSKGDVSLWNFALRCLGRVLGCVYPFCSLPTVFTCRCQTAMQLESWLGLGWRETIAQQD